MQPHWEIDPPPQQNKWIETIKAESERPDQHHERNAQGKKKKYKRKGTQQKDAKRKKKYMILGIIPSMFASQTTLRRVYLEIGTNWTCQHGVKLCSLAKFTTKL